MLKKIFVTMFLCAFCFFTHANPAPLGIEIGKATLLDKEKI